MARLLLAEDDAELAALVKERLEREGFEVVHVSDGEAAVQAVADGAPDLLVLDVMMPKLDGFGVCRAVRPEYRGPILMLTALDDDIDQVLGLELGADDYVVKPVKPRVLVARIRALLRRAAPAPPSDRIESGAVTIDANRRDVLVSGESR
ncbi:MAG: DNA-binding response OmpR family regulator, partial [Bradymonadia bacterium]